MVYSQGREPHTSHDCLIMAKSFWFSVYHLDGEADPKVLFEDAEGPHYTVANAYSAARGAFVEEVGGNDDLADDWRLYVYDDKGNPLDENGNKLTYDEDTDSWE